MSEGSKALFKMMKQRDRRDRARDRQDDLNLLKERVETKKEQITSLRQALADVVQKHADIGIKFLGAGVISELPDIKDVTVNTVPALDIFRDQYHAAKADLEKAEEQLKADEEKMKEGIDDLVFSSDDDEEDDEDDPDDIDGDDDNGGRENDPLSDIKWGIYEQLYGPRRFKPDKFGVSADKLCGDGQDEGQVFKALLEMNRDGEIVLSDDVHDEKGRPVPLDEIYVCTSYQNETDLFGDKEDVDEICDDDEATAAAAGASAAAEETQTTDDDCVPF